MKVEDFLTDPKTIELVLSSINKKVTLPNSGFLAGGSVANMLLSLYHSGTPSMFKINDVDIFIPQDPLITEVIEGEDMLRCDVTINVELHQDGDEDYGQSYIENDGTCYRVISSKRDGLINNVKCVIEHGQTGGRTHRYTPTGDEGQSMTPVTKRDGVISNDDPDNEIILRGFDLNCCQVGVDLKNNQIYYTKAFVNFLKSKQVLVNIPYTPFHTALRLVKKMKMYGDFCYCDIDYEIKYLYHAEGLEGSCMFFGKENYDKFIENKEALKKYLEITEVKIENMPHEYRKKYFPKSYVSTNTSFLQPRDNYLKTEMIEGRELWTYTFINNDDFIDDECDRLWELKRIWELKHRNLKKTQVKKIKTIMNYGNSDILKTRNYVSDNSDMSYLMMCLMTIDDYYDCDFTLGHLKEINRFVSEHHVLKGLISKCKNVQEQYNNVKMIRRLSKLEGDWVIGVLETLGVSEMTNNTVITKEWVDSLVEEEKNRMSTPLVKTLNLDDFKYKKNITELVVPLDLMAEGKKMGHCVGGYSHNITNGGSRIFNINVGGVQSTLEISLTKQDEWSNSCGESNDKKYFKIKQHSGRYPEKKGNQTPTNKCRGMAFKLVHYLSKQEMSCDEYRDMFTNKPYKQYYETDSGLVKNSWWDIVNDNHKHKNNPNKKKNNLKYNNNGGWMVG